MKNENWSPKNVTRDAHMMGAKRNQEEHMRRGEQWGCNCLTFACQMARAFIRFRGTREHARLQVTVSVKGGKVMKIMKESLGPPDDKEHGVINKKKNGKVIKDGE